MRDEDKVILIIDDDPDMCWALEQLLNKKGFFTQKALDGREALTLLERNCFKMVFLDAKLPDIEGLELARQILKIDPAIAIILVTGYFYKDDTGIQDALTEGLIRGFISKPFFNDEILKVIELTHSL